jgi:superoxide dismutase, Cu-Zn family
MVIRHRMSGLWRRTGVPAAAAPVAAPMQMNVTGQVGRLPIVALLASAALLAGCSPMGRHGMMHETGPKAQATLEPRSGSTTQGTVSLVQGRHHLMVRYDVRGLKPNAEHGFHIHEKGDCSAPDASSAGGHFNPTGQPHGHPSEPGGHLGDLPNLRADANGVARGNLTLDGVGIDRKARIVGLSIVVHRDPDDYRSQPAGNSGPRIACGVIRAA